MSVLERLESTVRSDTEKLEERLKKLRNRPRSRTTKLIKAASGRTATIAISPKLVDISAPDEQESEAMGISVIAGTGTIIRGPIGITNRPQDIRIAGFWVLNDLILSGMPSTIMTPIPVAKFSPPLETVAQTASNAATIAALIGFAV